MTIKFVKLPTFERAAKKLKWSNADQRKIEKKLTQYPHKGTELFKRVFKVRDSFRGGSRIITVVRAEETNTLYFAYLYLKSDREDLTDDEYAALSTTADMIDREIKKNAKD